MKLVLSIFFLMLTHQLLAQTIEQEADACFENGDYSCAIKTYDEASELVTGSFRDVILSKKEKAIRCKDLQTNAEHAFKIKDYRKAISYYEKILLINPKDSISQGKLVNSKSMLPPDPKISLSQNTFGFPPSRGSIKVLIESTHPYEVGNISASWCTVQKFPSYFIISYEENLTYQKRRVEFRVISEHISELIKIEQEESTIPRSISSLLEIPDENFRFNWEGGARKIYFTTSVQSFDFSTLPSWCKITKYYTYVSLECNKNLSKKSREEKINLTIDGVKGVIIVNQSEYIDVELSIQPKKIIFSRSGGLDEVQVFSKASNYQIKDIPEWCSITSKTERKFGIRSTINYGAKRKGRLVVEAGNEIKTIKIKQSKSLKAKENSDWVVRCFNCPRTPMNKNILGLNIGSITKDEYSGLSLRTLSDTSNIRGARLGFKIEPLFKYGFGLNTGLNFDYYFRKIEKIEFAEFGINLPLHIEYRLNFSKWFNVYGYGGLGYNFQTKDFSKSRMPITIEYGAGLRISKVQFTLGFSSYWGDINIPNSITTKTFNCKDIYRVSLSVAIMF